MVSKCQLRKQREGGGITRLGVLSSVAVLSYLSAFVLKLSVYCSCRSFYTAVAVVKNTVARGWGFCFSFEICLCVCLV